MSDAASAVFTLVALVTLLALAYVPLGDHLARTFTSPHHTRFERALYRLAGVAPDREQGVRGYLTALVAFTVVSILALTTLLLTQHLLPLNRGVPAMGLATAVNTAVSFVTNTNWQTYAGEAALGVPAQAAGLAVQNFLSAAVGLAVAIVLIRGFARMRADEIGNFWVDLTRGALRVLAPIGAVGAVLFLLAGVPQTFADTTGTDLAGHATTVPGGPIASQEAIKLLGTNGGGFLNANSAHPLENPSAATNLLSIFLMVLIPVALTRTLSTMLGDRRQGRAVLAVMTALFGAVLALAAWAEASAPAAGALEGRETRFGVFGSVLFGAVSTGTSTGAVNSAHDSWSAGGGGLLILHMMFGEVSPGGVGSGLYGILVAAIVAVFLAGLMVGRTPEYLGKKIGATQMRWVALYTVAVPVVVLAGIGITVLIPQVREAVGYDGPHGLSRLVYAFTSGGNNNGSAFGGLDAAGPVLEYGIASAMLAGRLATLGCVVALAGSLARQGATPTTAGTLPTHTPLFLGLVAGVVVGVSALSYVPALVLGPIAEALS